MFDFSVKGAVTVIGHDLSDIDSIASCLLLNKYLKHFGVDSRVALFTKPMENSVEYLKVMGVDFEAEVRQPLENEQVFLVDHHETAHSVKVVGCIDHHPTDKKYDYPVYINNKASSTAFMILEMMEAEGITPTEEDYAAAVLSVYSDTQGLKSSKLIKSDVPKVEALVQRYGFDEQFLLKVGYGLNDLGAPVEKLLYNGFKSFNFSKGRVVSSYLQADGYPKDFVERFIKAVSLERRRLKADMWVLLLHDPVNGNTVEYDITETVEMIDHKKLISRGSNVMPRIEKIFTEG